MDKATPSPASVDSVMAKAMMLVGALGDSCEAATSLPFLEAVTALRADVERLAAQVAPTEEMSPEFTDTARAALLWVLWHHQGGSSKVGQPIRFALGMDPHQPLSEYQVREAKRWEALDIQPSQAPVVQAGEYPPLPEGVKARFKCEDCGGTGYTGDMIPGSEFQPPEPVGCTSCNFTGWWAECEAYSADQMHAYLDADRASSGATTQAVRMPAVTAFNVGRFCLSEDDCIAQRIDFSAYERGVADAAEAFSRNA